MSLVGPAPGGVLGWCDRTTRVGGLDPPLGKTNKNRGSDTHGFAIVTEVVVLTGPRPPLATEGIRLFYFLVSVRYPSHL